MRNYIGVLAER